MVTLSPTRPEGAEAHSPGQRPGLFGAVTCRPVRAKALKLLAKLKLLPLQGALLIAFIPRAMPWAKSFCPYRACCSLELLTIHILRQAIFRDNPVPYTP